MRRSRCCCCRRATGVMSRAPDAVCLLTDLFRLTTQALDGVRLQRKKNAQTQKQMEEEAARVQVLTDLLASLSDQNLLLRETETAIADRVRDTRAVEQQLQEKETRLANLEEKERRLRQEFESKKETLEQEIASLRFGQEELTAAAVAQETQQLQEKVALLEKQMEEDRIKATEARVEEQTAKQLHETRVRSLREQYEIDIGKRRHAFAKKLQRIEQEIASLEPQLEGELKALRVETEKKKELLMQAIEEKQLKRKRLEQTLSLIPEEQLRLVSCRVTVTDTQEDRRRRQEVERTRVAKESRRRSTSRDKTTRVLSPASRLASGDNRKASDAYHSFYQSKRH